MIITSRRRVKTYSLCAGILIILALAGCSGLKQKPAAVSLSSKTIPEMLEMSLPAIVTVGVYQTEELATVYGFGESKIDVAYQKALDLSHANSSGSGFIIERNGKKYIITNAHVIDYAAGNEEAISVFSINRTKYPVRVVGADSFYDVAVLEFIQKEPGIEISTIDFRTTEPRLGEEVFAIGNPLGSFPYTVTQGIIGGKNRVRDGLTGKFGYIQSSAVIIWGNSGGPLVDSDGKVVGINSQIHITQDMVHPQLNFALESGIARRVIDDLIRQGRMSRAFIGFSVIQELDLESGLMDEKGPMVSDILPGSPAEKVLSDKKGYKVARINAIPVRNIEEVLGELEKLSPGETVSIDLEQRSEKISVSFAVGELTDDRKGDLANFFLKSFASMEASPGRNGLTLRHSKDCERAGASASLCGRRYVFFEYDPVTRVFFSMQDELGEFDVTASGSASDQLWKTGNLANLGMSIRFAALQGMVSFFMGGSDDERRLIKMMLTDNERTLLKTLLY